MPVIAFINQKGGCAKSTTSVHFAYWLYQQHHRVLVVDADAQRSSSIWLESIKADLPISFEVLQTPDELLDQIPQLATKCDYLVVDGAAGLAESTRAVLFRADLAVVPCQPTGVDLRSASDAIRLIRQAQSVRGGVPSAAVFLSRAVKGTKLLGEAIALLNESDIPVLNTVVYQRQVVADTFGQGATVWNMPGKPAAESANEFDSLFREILGILP